MVNGRVYAIEISKVYEIKGRSEPTESSNADHAIRSVLTLRGVVVPIFRLYARFDQRLMEARAGHVIRVALRDRLIRVVDAVSDILTAALSMTQEPFIFGTSVG